MARAQFLYGNREIKRLTDDSNTCLPPSSTRKDGRISIWHVDTITITYRTVNNKTQIGQIQMKLKLNLLNWCIVLSVLIHYAIICNFTTNINNCNDVTVYNYPAMIVPSRHHIVSLFATIMPSYTIRPLFAIIPSYAISYK